MSCIWLGLLRRGFSDNSTATQIVSSASTRSEKVNILGRMRRTWLMSCWVSVPGRASSFQADVLVFPSAAAAHSSLLPTVPATPAERSRWRRGEVLWTGWEVASTSAVFNIYYNFIRFISNNVFGVILGILYYSALQTWLQSSVEQELYGYNLGHPKTSF